MLSSTPTPTASATVTSTSLAINLQDDSGWFSLYISTHSLENYSHVYAYYLWIVIAVLFSISIALHFFNLLQNRIGMIWTRWALRRMSYTPPKLFFLDRIQGPFLFPANGRLAGLSVFLFVLGMLAFAGPDYAATSPNTVPSQKTIKNWWTSAGRTGMLAFALFPLCILFTLKASPFAIFSLPFTTQYHFDKLAWLHSWSARCIWFLTACHTVMWSIQLSKDQDEKGESAYLHAWKYDNFVYGWIAFLLMTFILLFSSDKFRKPHYEAFYIIHLLLFPLTLVACALHHPNAWWWIWSGLCLWVAERIWRGIRYFYTNNLIFGSSANQTDEPQRLHRLACPCYREAAYCHEYLSCPYPAPGHAYAELLAGATVRLTYAPPRPFRCAPGQYFLVKVPKVSFFKSHPFTAASIQNNHDNFLEKYRETIVFLIRAKDGWTKDLWDHIVRENMVTRSSISTLQSPTTVLLKMNVDGPFGSALRVNWESYSTIIVIVGGSGVSFGISIVEYICSVIAKHNQGNMPIRDCSRREFTPVRLRFVWLVREYGHIQWCATILHRCLSILPSSVFEANIFVTKPQYRGPSTSFDAEPLLLASDNLVPPTLPFAPHTIKRISSTSSLDSNDSTNSLVEGSSFCDDREQSAPSLVETGIQLQSLDNLTNFERDNEIELPGEKILNSRIKKEGRFRRMLSKRHRQLRNVVQHEKNRSREAESFPSQEGMVEGRGRRLLTFQPSPLPWSNAFKEENSLICGLSDIDLVTAEFPGFCTPGTGPSSTIYNVNKPLPAVPEQSAYPPHHASDKFMHPRNSHLFSDFAIGSRGAIPYLQISEQESFHVAYLAELVRQGRPKLDRILRDEMKKSTGPVVVAACGPISLNTLVRETIANHLKTERLRGDNFITFVSEEFDY